MRSHDAPDVELEPTHATLFMSHSASARPRDARPPRASTFAASAAHAAAASLNLSGSISASDAPARMRSPWNCARSMAPSMRATTCTYSNAASPPTAASSYSTRCSAAGATSTGKAAGPRSAPPPLGDGFVQEAAASTCATHEECVERPSSPTCGASGVDADAPGLPGQRLDCLPACLCVRLPFAPPRRRLAETRIEPYARGSRRGCRSPRRVREPRCSPSRC